MQVAVEEQIANEADREARQGAQNRFELFALEHGKRFSPESS